MASKNKLKKCKNAFLSKTMQKSICKLKRIMFYNKTMRVEIKSRIEECDIE